jgi:hypothetical protein
MMMGNQIIPANDTRIGRKRSPIDLRIQGDDIFLSGHFHRWQSAVSMGPDLDELSVRLAVDVTSPDQLTVDPEEQDLFSFRSTEVTKLLPHTFRVQGKLTAPDGQGASPFGMLVEVAEGHNAFIALSFVARKDELGPSWMELVTAGVGAGGIDAERLLDPRAGVRDPELATA